jgi:ribosomal protein L40E
MYCKRCGSELPQDAAFCPKCGINLAENGASFNNSPTLSDSTLLIYKPRCPRCYSYNVRVQAERKAFNPFIIIVSLFVFAILIPIIATVLAALIAEAVAGATAVPDATYAAAATSGPIGALLGIVFSIVGCVRRSRTYNSVSVCQNCGYSSRAR